MTGTFFKSVLIILLLNATLATAKETARVIRVKDGDTYVFRNDTKEFTVRLKNIDAPESKQQYGFQSALYVSQLILGKVVQYESTGTDIYKRVLADVWIDNKRLDSILVRNGWAWQYIQYSNDILLKQCMQLAIDEKIGLWKCGTMAVCPPSLWRKYSTKEKIKYCSGCK
ncbi:MAG TPA: thermonuclease family protein [Chitinophagales bacterium]|nr:thermonuclease family protein [Chitinophagales bacterium]HNO02987.1 thermonuclease family protein [Chitinophagales bacterium]